MLAENLKHLRSYGTHWTSAMGSYRAQTLELRCHTKREPGRNKLSFRCIPSDLVEKTHPMNWWPTGYEICCLLLFSIYIFLFCNFCSYSMTSFFFDRVDCYFVLGVWFFPLYLKFEAKFCSFCESVYPIQSHVSLGSPLLESWHSSRVFSNHHIAMPHIQRPTRQSGAHHALGSWQLLLTRTWLLETGEGPPKEKKTPFLRREKNLSFPGSSPGDPLGGCLSDLFWRFKVASIYVIKGSPGRNWFFFLRTNISWHLKAHVTASEFTKGWSSKKTGDSTWSQEG